MESDLIIATMDDWIASLTIEDLKFFLVLCAGTFVTTFFLALSKKAIVFEDSVDLMWSVGIVLSPIVGFCCLAFITPDPIPDGFNIFWESLKYQLITSAMVVMFFMCIYKTYANSINSNGLFLGLFIGTARVIASVLILLSLMGFFNQLTSKSRNLAMIAVTMIFFGIFSYIVRTMINGSEVRTARAG